jgi:antibiotic biosynthesis monooxygenase (ABM) superfamily enzyme
MPQRHVLVISLWVHPGQEAAFEAFEREAARLMARHGGRIDQAVRIARGQGEAPHEIHVVSFPDEAAYQAYGADPYTAALREGRAKIISRTAVLEGQEAGRY